MNLTQNYECNMKCPNFSRELIYINIKLLDLCIYFIDLNHCVHNLYLHYYITD